MLEIPAPNGADPPADRRHRRRLLRSAGHDPDGSQLFISYWNDDSVNVFRVYLKPGRAGAGRAAQRILERYAGKRQVFVLTNGELQELHPEDHRPVVRPDVGADRGRGARGDSRHRQHADRVDHRSAARARRAAGGRRAARPDPAHDLDRGAQHRRARPGARASRSARSISTTSCRSCTTTSPACGSTTVSGRQSSLALVPTILGAAFIAAIWPAESAVRGSLVEALEYE